MLCSLSDSHALRLLGEVVPARDTLSDGDGVSKRLSIRRAEKIPVLPSCPVRASFVGLLPHFIDTNARPWPACPLKESVFLEASSNAGIKPGPFRRRSKFSPARGPRSEGCAMLVLCVIGKTGGGGHRVAAWQPVRPHARGRGPWRGPVALPPQRALHFQARFLEVILRDRTMDAFHVLKPITQWPHPHGDCPVLRFYPQCHTSVTSKCLHFCWLDGVSVTFHTHFSYWVKTQAPL